MKRVIAIAVTAAVLTAMPSTVLAGGHHGGGHHGTQSYTAPAVCETLDCALIGLHSHDGVTSVTHYYGDGHGHISHTGYHH